MDRDRALALAAVAAGVVLIALAGVYFAEPAHSLPTFFPGHAGSGSSERDHHHVKHGIAALIVGLAAFAYAWMNTGPNQAARRSAGGVGDA